MVARRSRQHAALPHAAAQRMAAEIGQSLAEERRFFFAWQKPD
jgi:hypothetical protein